MCVLSSKQLFGGTDWIENWRRGDKHKLGLSPKKNKNIGHLQNLPLTAMCGGITCGDDNNLRIIHPLYAKYSFSFLRQISNRPAFLAMVKEYASFRRIPERQKNISKMTLQLQICFVCCFVFQYRWDEKFWVMKSFESTFFAIYTFQLTGWLLVRASNDFVALFDENLLCAFSDISPAQVFRFPVSYRV